MGSPLHAFLAEDHARLEGLLRRAGARPDEIDAEAYEQFRAGLVRHIAMEEKVLLPEARRMRGDVPLPIAAQLRSDHGALASLLVPAPTHPIIRWIREILEPHDALEEGAGGLYETCEQLAGSGAAALVERLRATPEVPLAPHQGGPRVHEHIARLMQARARGK